MIRLAVALVVGWYSLNLAFADPPKIDRTIGKQPVYKSENPKYGLLVFGPEAKNRVWLVLDGDTLYVDRNGNGDLTEPGKKVAAEKKPGQDAEEDGHAFEVGDLDIGGRQHKGLGISFEPLKSYADSSVGKRDDIKAALKKDPKGLAVTMQIDVQMAELKGGGVGGRVSYMVGPLDLAGWFQFADSPAEAPIVHFDGPLQVTFYAELPSVRVGRSSDWVLVVGTPGVGPGTFAMISYEDTIPKGLKPVADITYSGSDGDMKQRAEITGRC